MNLVLSHARKQDGFGLIELLMSMVMLNVGILALVAAFQSGAVALKRAAKVSTAAAIADIQMERFRAIRYSCIALDQTSLTTAGGDATYTGDSAYSAGQLATATPCSASPLGNEHRPVRDLVGPDGKQYRVDTYVVAHNVDNGRPLKRVTIVVRDRTALTGRPLARVGSTFDESTGS